MPKRLAQKAKPETHGGSMMLRLVSEDGHVVDTMSDLTDARWRPLGYSELVAHIAKRTPVSVRLSSVELSIKGPELNHRSVGSLNAEFIPKGGVITMFALVEGGWLPVPLLPAVVLYPDANIARNVSALAAQLAQQSGAKWELGIGGRLISPLLPALEGNQRRLPSSLDEIEAAVAEIARKLEARFPRQVYMPTTEAYLGAWGLVEERRHSLQSETAFLLQVLPRLSARVAEQSLLREYDAVEATAARHGIQRESFLFLLVLDCLFDRQFVERVKRAHMSAGRAVLKPKPRPTVADAYNALSDVWLLAFAAMVPAVTRANTVAVCTQDMGLTKAWSMFAPRDTRLAGPRNAVLTLSLTNFGARMLDDLRSDLLGKFVDGRDTT